MERDPRVDAYVARQAEFARPILKRLREAVHAACPDCEEAIKWGMPAFLYKGGILAHMAAFKAHAAFGFWRGSEVVGEGAEQKSAMGQFGRIRSIDDLPSDAVLSALIAKAMKLADSGAKPVREKRMKPPPDMPADLRAALDSSPAAFATYEGFSPSARRDYLGWVTEAKRPETRARRIAQAVEWMAEGKKRNWKYEKC